MEPVKFLVVEDNELDVLRLKTVLKDMGVACSLSVVKDGEKAVDYMLKRHGFEGVPDPDLIFLDLHLPKLNGVEVLQAVPNSRKLPLCVVTGSEVERDEMKNLFGIRRIAYLVKPVNRYGILNCFRMYEHLWPVAEEVSSALS